MAEDTLLLKDRDDASADPDPPETPSRCNRKALAAFFGVAVIATVVIVFSVVLSVYSGGGSLISKLRRSSFSVSFDEAFSGKYSPQRYVTNWIDDDKYLAFNSATQTMDIIDLSNNSTRPLLPPEDYGKVMAYRHWLSSDSKHIMFAKNVKQQYRYSFFADYYVYNTETRDIIPINPPTGDSSEKIAYAAWNNEGYSMVFVYKNDVYYMASPTAEPQRLTTTGQKNKIYNGIPDWVYQEEILNSDNTIWFSPEGRYLCYAEIDDTDVPWYEFSWYGDYQENYTSVRKIPYPKSGYPNPTVKVKVIDLHNLPSAGKAVPTQVLHEPDEFKATDHYITTVAWGTEGIVTVTWLNREQNKSIMKLCRRHGSDPWVCGEASPVTVTDGWVDDKYPTPLFSADGSYFLTVMAFPSENKGEFLHLTQVDVLKRPPAPRQLTFGAWEVESLLVFDDEREIVYFTSTEVSPTQRHVYSYALNENKKTCLTCDLPETQAGKSKYYSATFSTKGSWYNLASQGPDIPTYSLRSTKTDRVIVLQNNEDLRKRLPGAGALPTVVTYTIKSDGNDIHVKEVRPPNFDMKKKYAVLFSVYGGPATQKVIDSWSPLDWENGYLVTNFDVILVTVDARGTKGRGESFKHAVYRHFGKYEARDTINVGRHLQQQSYVDPDKIAIWGWSFGGFLTSYILGTDKGETFKVGMAVAPVTDWRYYDSIYTERYMMQPKDNPSGYKESSVLRLAKNIKDDTFLVVHGTGDDNVHFQNTAQLVRALTRAEVKYRVQFYVDKNHGLFGKHTKNHLFRLLTNFLSEKLWMRWTG